MRTLFALFIFAILTPQATAGPVCIWGPGPTAKCLAPLASPAGTVSLPGITAGTDQTSGLYSIGTGDIAIAAGGVLGMELLKVGSNVNVGIGVAASNNNPFAAQQSVNGTIIMSLNNQSGASSSTAIIEVLDGGTAPLSLENKAYNTVDAYINGGGVLRAATGLTGLSIASEQSTGYIKFNVGGASALGTEVMQLDANHHVNFHQTTAPTVTAGCGSSPTVTGSDTAGVLNVGTGGSATTCTITFNKTFTTTPHCFVNDETTAVALKAAPTATTLVISAVAAFTASSLIDYYCVNHY